MTVLWSCATCKATPSTFESTPSGSCVHVSTRIPSSVDHQLTNELWPTPPSPRRLTCHDHALCFRCAVDVLFLAGWFEIAQLPRVLRSLWLPCSRSCSFPCMHVCPPTATCTLCCVIGRSCTTASSSRWYDVTWTIGGHAHIIRVHLCHSVSTRVPIRVGGGYSGCSHVSVASTFLPTNWFVWAHSSSVTGWSGQATHCPILYV